MTKFKLDEDARSKLREIVEKRAHDQKEVLVQIEKHLETSTNASSMLCKIARPLIDGEPLADPPDRPAGARHPSSGGGGHGGGDRLNPVAQEARSGYDRDRRGDRGDRGDRADRDRDRRDRSR